MSLRRHTVFGGHSLALGFFSSPLSQTCQPGPANRWHCLPSTQPRQTSSLVPIASSLVPSATHPSICHPSLLAGHLYIVVGSGPGSPHLLQPSKNLSGSCLMNQGWGNEGMQRAMASNFYCFFHMEVLTLRSSLWLFPSSDFCALPTLYPRSPRP